MNKPISIAIRETKENLLNAVNRSLLPPDVLQMLVSELAQLISIKAEERYNRDLAEYEASLKEGEEKEDGD